MGKLVFGPGGSYHRPDHPHEFPPGLWAAAHYLKAVQEVAPRVRRKLSDEVLGKHTFPRHFPGWQGLELTRDQIALDPIPGRPVEPQQTRFDEALPFLRAFQAWANEYYMWSPFVLDLLYRTLELWDRIDREIAELQGSIREAEEYDKQRPLTEEDRQIVESEKTRLEFLKEEQGGWGWWVDFLSAEIAVSKLSAWFLNRTAESESHRRLFERMDRLRIDITWEPPAAALPFRLILEGWRPEVETWETAKKRFQVGFDQALKNYRRIFDGRLKTGSLNPRPKDSKSVKWGKPHRWKAAPSKHSGDHFAWLALRQVKGLRPQEIADCHTGGKAVSTVNEAIESTARLLQLELRPVRPGPPSVLGY